MLNKRTDPTLNLKDESYLWDSASSQSELVKIMHSMFLAWLLLVQNLDKSPKFVLKFVSLDSYIIAMILYLAIARRLFSRLGISKWCLNNFAWLNAFYSVLSYTVPTEFLVCSAGYFWARWTHILWSSPRNLFKFFTAGHFP